MSATTRRDLRELWGLDFEAQCRCSAGGLKEHQSIRRAGWGPRKESDCAHEIAKMDMRCIYCRKTEWSIYNESFADGAAGKKYLDNYSGSNEVILYEKDGAVVYKSNDTRRKEARRRKDLALCLLMGAAFICGVVRYLLFGV